MPVKTKSSSKSSKVADPSQVLLNRSASASSYELIGRMMEYEKAARNRGINLTTGRFRMLTASERDYFRAELIADYIRLCIGNLGNTPGYFDATLQSFCSKICDIEIPSHELIGTYLACMKIAAEDECLKSIPFFSEAIRSTMTSVLQTCARMLNSRTKASAQKAAPKYH